jgi:long-subunit acyl-CoA synthetase (AMP-forming)
MKINPYPHIKPTDRIAINYTCGTTGDPKLVMLSQLNLISCITVIKTI